MNFGLCNVIWARSLKEVYILYGRNLGAEARGLLVVSVCKHSGVSISLLWSKFFRLTRGKK